MVLVQGLPAPSTSIVYACFPVSTITTVGKAVLTLEESSDMYYHDFAISSSAARRTLVQYVKLAWYAAGITVVRCMSAMGSCIILGGCVHSRNCQKCCCLNQNVTRISRQQDTSSA